ncbi:hypothetical protein L3X39_13790 [Sabulilitoribacter multivorans]|uniref:Uncharacterized protein n=1 Tax=Flaviramulus multivorans TaxID=1304750 RepID=A0ABS9IMA3_9FLAO|nr:hypothetical protein [Flaviramulus multivorans]MCF7561715.1 hypothetical protein [Flaviramulus multivorans]
MDKKPVTKVQLVGKEKQYYFIKFPDLKIPVKVNDNLYTKMLHSNEYEFCNLKEEQLKTQVS